MRNTNNACKDWNKRCKQITNDNMINDIHDDDALANWHTLNERVEKSGPVGN